MKNLLIFSISAFLRFASYPTLVHQVSYRINQKGLIKISKNLLAMYFIMFFAFSTIAGLFLFNPFGTKQADAAWFNDNWPYRHQVTFTHNADLTVDRSVTFTLDTAELITAGLMQSDCDDTRFTDPSGTILRFDLTGTCNNAATTYEVIFPKVFNGANLFYVYYGNPGSANTEIDSTTFTALTPNGGDPSLTNPTSSGNQEKAPSSYLYWKMDDGQGLSSQDSSSSNEDLTLTGSNRTPAWKTEDQCVSGKCLYFDGVANPNGDEAHSTNQLDLTNTNVITVEFWMKWMVYDNNDSLAMEFSDNFNNVNGGFVVNPDASDNSNQFGVYVDGNTGPNGVDFARPSTNAWHHYGLVLDKGAAGASEITPYVDGVAVAYTKRHSNNNTDNFGDEYLYLMNRALASLYGQGYLDDIKIYTQARSAAQIKADFNAKGNPEGVAAVLGANTQNMPAALSNGLVGYWKMDETDWTDDCSTGTILDSSGNGNNGISCPNAGGTDPTAGKFGNAGDFDGSDDHAQIPDPGSGILDFGTGNFTSSVWVYKRHTAVGTAFDDIWAMGKWTNGGVPSDNEWVLLTGDGSTSGDDQPEFWISNGSTIYTAAATSELSINSWNLLTGVREGDTMKLYVNGALAASASLPAGLSIANVGGRDLALASTDAGVLHSDMKLDEVRVYNRALSSNEVTQLYNWAPGPVGYWKWDDGSGSSVIDSSTNAYTGTWAGTTGSQWTSGKYGKAGSFNGTDNFVNTTNNTVFDANGSYITFESWIKPTSTASNFIAAKGGTSAGGWYVNKGASNDISVLFKSGSSTGVARTSATNALTSNAWNHVAVIMRVDTSSSAGNNDIQIYVNGTLNQGSMTNSLAPTISTAKLKFGVRGEDSSESGFYTGQTDESKVYNYARSQAQIIEDMNAGHPAPGSPVGTAVGRWKFDEGFGDTANNSGSGGSILNLDLASSSNACPGATNCPTPTNSGKFNKALDFDGSNDYAQIPDNDALNFVATSSYSWTMWVNADSLPNTGSPACNAIPLFRKGNTAKGYIAGIEKGTGKLLFFDFDASRTCYVSNSAPVVTTGSWFHLGYVYVNGTVNFYLNGVPVGSATGGTYLDDDSSAVIVGATGADNNNREPFDGKIDEVKYYTQALTADQIKADMNQSQAQVVGSLSSTQANPNAAASLYCIPGDASTCTSPVGEWNLDEGTSTTANDSSGNGNTGTLANSPPWTNGKVNKGINFIGGSDQYVTIPASASLNDLGPLTFEAWIYPRTTGDSTIGRVFDKMARTTAGMSLQRIQFLIDYATTDLQRITTDTVPLNQWSHIAISWDGSTTAANADIYINGREATAYTTTTDGNGARQSDAAGALVLGNRSTDSARDFDGIIDQPKMFNYARTSAQIAWDYNKGKPVGQWGMDECQGMTINDSSGNSLTGTLTIGGTGTNTAVGTCVSSGAWANGAGGKRNYSMDFDGTDDYIAVADNDKLDLTTNFSISAWIKPDTLPGACGDFSGVKSIFNKGRDSTGTYSYTLHIDCAGSPNVNGTINFGLYDGSNNPQAYGATVMSTGTWYHVVGTYDGASMKAYLNGKQDGATTSTTVTPGAQTSPAAIGKNANASNRYFDGLIDDVRVYNYALTAEQVKTLTNEGAVRYGPSTGAP